MATNEMDIDPSENWDALRNAVVNRQPTVILYLLQRNADPRFTDQNGNTALHMVFGMDPFLVNQPLIIATLGVLLDAGMDPNATNDEGKTALHLAIKYRLREVIDFLITRGAELNVCDANGDSTAHLMVDSEFDQFCATCWSVDFTPSKKRFSEEEGKSFVSWLISKGLNFNCINNDGISPAHLAAQLNLQHILLELLNRIDDRCINYANRNNQNILHSLLESLAQNEHFGLKGQKKPASIPFQYDRIVTTNIVKSLLEKGISVDLVDKNGNTPLHLAVKQTENQSFYLYLTKLMLEKFDNVDACDLDGNTVLHAILINCQEYNTIFDYNSQSADRCDDHVRILLSKGSNVHIKNKDGLVPLQIAIWQHFVKVVEMFADHEADFNVLHDNGNLLHFLATYKYPEMDKRTTRSTVDLLVFHGCDVNSVNNYGFTPLHFALRSRNAWIADRLFELGADVRARERTEDSFTTLHLAVHYGYEESYVVKFIETGIDVNVRDARGRTPLHLATSNVIALLHRGAHVDARDHEGNLPLHAALRSENADGVTALIEYGADINDENTLREIESSIAREGCAYVTILHWLKLRAVGLPANDGLASCVDEYCESSWGDAWTQRFQLKCARAVEALKARKIDGRLSWYGFLHMEPNRRCAFVKANDIESKLSGVSFPMYKRVILGAFHQALARMPLLDVAVDAWYQLDIYYLPDICVQRIYSNLSNEDLRNVIGSIECHGR